MAILKTTTPIAVLRKKFGKYAIFTEYNDKIIMRSRPDYSKRIWTDAERETRQRLKDACKMTRLILDDPVRRAEYEIKCAPEQSLYNMVRYQLMKKI
jgi:hypothetical protein